MAGISGIAGISENDWKFRGLLESQGITGNSEDCWKFRGLALFFIYFKK
jgi:hypothetical protein